MVKANKSIPDKNDSEISYPVQNIADVTRFQRYTDYVRWALETVRLLVLRSKL